MYQTDEKINFAELADFYEKRKAEVGDITAIKDSLVCVAVKFGKAKHGFSEEEMSKAAELLLKENPFPFP